MHSAFLSGFPPPVLALARGPPPCPRCTVNHTGRGTAVSPGTPRAMQTHPRRQVLNTHTNAHAVDPTDLLTPLPHRSDGATEKMPQPPSPPAPVLQGPSSHTGAHPAPQRRRDKDIAVSGQQCHMCSPSCCRKWVCLVKST
uniref:Uncharacterized protein n=1 Tax=Eutreptiella gymnastica TaxID=73025 RepID=A0A7S4FPD2_9EUGL